MSLYGVNLSNTADQVRNNLPALARYASVEVQMELSLTTRNADGAAFGLDGFAPAPWLERQGVEVWGHVNALWPPDPTALGGSILPPENDAYWLRRKLVAAIAENDWWLYGDNAGKRTPVLGSYKRPCPDITIEAYRRYALELILASGMQNIRFDDGFVHRHGYYRPWRAERTDMALLQGAAALYGALRELGKRVIVNGAWEPFDPREGTGPKDWTYPLADAVDGVMIEYPSGFARWDNGRWYPLAAIDTLTDLVGVWRQQRKEVIVSVLYRTDAAESFDAFARRWYDFGERNDCRVAIASGWGEAPWLPWYPERTPPSAPPLQLAELEKRVAALEAWRTRMQGANQ